MKQIFDEVNNLKISDIISLRIELLPHGSEFTALCPFHDDHKIGSFMVNDGKGLFKCFSCGVGGNGIKFIALYDNISYYMAALKIALAFDIIDGSTYERLSKQKPSNEDMQQLRQSKRQEVDIEEIADAKTLNYVYSILSMGNRLFDATGSALSEEHLDYLHQRGISDEEIERYGYFTMPEKKALPQIIKHLKKKGNEAEMLLGVPGFYKYKNSKQICMNVMKGIGLPIRNVQGQIVGIQVRRDNIKDGAKRYRWFSSSFNNKEKTEYSLSPGSPLDVVYPKQIKYRTLFITEGHFKAAAIARQFQCTAISVQGIGNYAGILDTIRELNNENDYYQYIYIAYDADMAYNVQVFTQASAMGNKIGQALPELKLSYVLWDVENGKGIDDLIENGKGNTCWQVPLLTFQRTYNQMLMDLMRKQNVLKVKDLKINRDEIKNLFLTDVYLKLKQEKINQNR